MAGPQFEKPVQDVVNIVSQIVQNNPTPKGMNGPDSAALVRKQFGVGAFTAENVEAQFRRDVAMMAHDAMGANGVLDTKSPAYTDMLKTIQGERVKGHLPAWVSMKLQTGSSFLPAIGEEAVEKIGRFGKKAGPVVTVLAGTLTASFAYAEEGELNMKVADKTAAGMIPGYEAAKKGDVCSVVAEGAGFVAGAGAGIVVGGAASTVATPFVGVPAGIAADIAVNMGVTAGVEAACGPVVEGAKVAAAAVGEAYDATASAISGTWNRLAERVFPSPPEQKASIEMPALARFEESAPASPGTRPTAPASERKPGQAAPGL